MTIDYSIDGQVTFRMDDYVEKVLTERPEMTKPSMEMPLTQWPNIYSSLIMTTQLSWINLMLILSSSQ